MERLMTDKDPIHKSDTHKRPVTKIRLVSVSAIKECPECGTDDWITPKRKPDGSFCHHPTRFPDKESAQPISSER